MKKLHFVALAAMLAMTFALACEDTVDPPPPDPPVVYQPLTTRVAVLNNLEAAYNNRNIGELDKLLDPEFSFHLSDGDVNGGLPPQWNRATEMDVSTNLFSDTEDPLHRWPLCTSIDFDLDLSNPDWVDIVPPPVADEHWSMVTVFYDFQIAVNPDTKFYPYPGAKVRFTVRNNGTDENPHWQLVEAEDLGGGSALVGTHATATEESTWGKVKSLFRGDS
ncbi:MAG: hypothetical protein OEX18_13790 [Candidatus Krumholzibacteria bacterium]|nr:hypothetical protein [Candidatus Krumholzibacteria bacterium]MDH4338339.1 hypothetical protein [Candidatus Krumholzibacteria bacterium]MDH5270755.1 hypothetical protein [Candidatus Krumholzibacteria bacterium]MDH5626734.1 hypothetical protein [Candidatus Krumholzibacteria bacterium]